VASSLSGAPPVLRASADRQRRTVQIRGRGAERGLPSSRVEARRRVRGDLYARRAPDRVVLWAAILGVLLVLVAAVSAHAAAEHHIKPPAGAQIIITSRR
jgi:hypothetical protein